MHGYMWKTSSFFSHLAVFITLTSVSVWRLNISCRLYASFVVSLEHVFQLSHQKKKKIFDSKMINYWSSLYMMANVSINSLTQWSHLIINSWSKFGLPLDNFSLAASDPLVLISLAEMELTERKVQMTTKDKFQTWVYYHRKNFKSQYLSIITVIIFYNV